jgi:hypothetical protein
MIRRDAGRVHPLCCQTIRIVTFFTSRYYFLCGFNSHFFVSNSHHMSGLTSALLVLMHASVSTVSASPLYAANSGNATAASTPIFPMLQDDASKSLDVKQLVVLASIVVILSCLICLGLTAAAWRRSCNNRSLYNWTILIALYALATTVIGIVLALYGDQSRLLYLLYLPHNFIELQMLVLGINRGRFNLWSFGVFMAHALLMIGVVLLLPFAQAVLGVGAQGQSIDWLLMVYFGLLAFRHRPAVRKDLTRKQWQALLLLAIGGAAHAISGFLLGVSASLAPVFYLSFVVQMPCFGVAVLLISFTNDDGELELGEIAWRLPWWQYAVAALVAAAAVCILGIFDLFL